MHMYELYPTVPTIGAYKRWDVVTTTNTIRELKDTSMFGGKTAYDDTDILSDLEIEKNVPIGVICDMMLIYGVRPVKSENGSEVTKYSKKELIAMLNDDHKRILSFLVNGRKEMVESIDSYKDWSESDLIHLTVGCSSFFVDLDEAVAQYNGKQVEE